MCWSFDFTWWFGARVHEEVSTRISLLQENDGRASSLAGEVWLAAACAKRTILGNDSEDSDTIIVKVEPTGPGGFHDETRWLDPIPWSVMRGGVRRAVGDGGEDGDKPED